MSIQGEGKSIEEAYYTQYGVPFSSGRFRANGQGFYQHEGGNQNFQEKRQSLEETLNKFISESAKRHDEHSVLFKEIRASTNASTRNQGSSIKALEIQICQMSKVLQQRGFGSLPSATESNPRDHVKAFTTSEEPFSNSYFTYDSCSISQVVQENYINMKEKPKIPFPGRLKKNGNIDATLEENMAMMQIQETTKEILKENGESDKSLLKLLKEKEVIESKIKATLSEKCSAILKDVIPPKEKDPGSFTLPCSIGNMKFDKALADLGASVCVIPYSTFLKLGLGQPSPTRLIIEMADKTVKVP